VKDSFFDQNQSDLEKKGKTFLHWGALATKKVYRNLNFDPQSWDLPDKIQTLFQENYHFNLPAIETFQQGQDGTVKFLFLLKDKRKVETVLVPFKNHFSLCVSTQVGCAFACTFCFTGTKGFTRNLLSSEIVGQFLQAKRWLQKRKNEKRPLTNIIYMGQGEPLHNVEEVKKATEIFLNPNGLGIAPRKVSLSTVGHVPGLEKLKDFPPINLSVSLHAATDKKRNVLMPINKKYNLETLMRTLKSISLGPRKKISFEYLMIKNFNDQKEDIEMLRKLLEGVPSQLNLIPYNSYPGSLYEGPSMEHIYDFQKSLKSAGCFSTIRKTKGHDILAACGQLNDVFH